VLAASDPRVTLRVGGAMLALLAASVAFAVFLLGRLELGAAVRVRVYFAHVAALRTGAPLIVAGRAIGTIEDIALVPSNRAPAGHPLHGTGGAAALVRIDEDAAWMVPINGEIFVSSRGALSDRYLEVAPPAGGAEPGRSVRAGDALRGIDPPSLDRALQRTWDNLVRARLFLEAVRPEWDAFVAELEALEATLDAIEPAPGAYQRSAGAIKDAVASAGAAWDRALAAGLTPDAVRELLARAGDTASAIDRASGQLRGRVAALRAGIERVRAELDGRGDAAVADVRRALDGADAALAKLDVLVARARSLAAAFARGEGSMARLMRDPEFPEDAKDLGKVLKRHPWRLMSRPQDDDRDADSAESVPVERAPSGGAPRRR
jgi:ABC-type transporter Mla subunit MlaD